MTTLQSPALLVSPLLDDYRTGAFCFASPGGTLLAGGVVGVVPQSGGSLAQRTTALLAAAGRAGYREPIVVGSVPFDPDGEVRLVVPATVGRAGAVSGAEIKKTAVRAHSVRPDPEPELFTKAVAEAVQRLKSGELEKVVLSRSLHIAMETSVDVAGLLRTLAHRDPRGYTFAVDLTDGPVPPGQPVEHRTLVGASPELLVSKHGDAVVSHPLAGSAKRSADPVEDARRGAELLKSAKDRREHAVVVDAIAGVVRPYCTELTVPAEPSLVRTAAMWHLGTKIEGKLRNAEVSVLELAEALHPTPAVCGTPTDKARDVINELEPYDRDFYTGMTGWCDARGDGEWIVTIRCAEVVDKRVTLYAGAGIVAESDPDSELAETTAKFGTMLNALGLGDNR
jgi:isochorismate synthase